MYRICTTLNKFVPTQILSRLGLLLCLVFFTSHQSPANSPPRPEPDKAAPPGSAAYAPDSYWGPLRLKLVSVAAAVANDPIRFSVQASHQTVRLGEPLELIITAELLNISPNLLFFQPGANAYTLRMLLPAGFEQTGGDFTDYVTGVLSHPTRPLMNYRIQGYFSSVTAGTSFRLLRGQPDQGDQGLFVEKAIISLRTESDQPAVAERKESAGRGGLSAQNLYVVTDKGSVGGAARVEAASYRGFLDVANCETVSGWILDQNNPNKSQQVDIYLNGVRATTLLANQPRQDVADAFGIKKFNAFGYVWVIPSLYKTNVPLQVSVRPAGTSIELSQSPKQTGICPGTVTTTIPPANQAPRLVQAISAQSAVVGQGFSLVIPSGTFTDPEGQPLTYSMSGLPAGLSFSGSTLSGTPTTAGQSTLTLTATDPGGLQATTSFVLTVTAPTTAAPTNTCTNFGPSCSGNTLEVSTVTINVATAGNYPLIIGYRSNERAVDGLVGINGVQQTVRFNYTTVFTTMTMPSVALRAGANTITLSTGAGGGYLCFNSVCVGTPPPPASCNFTISANTLNATCNQPGIQLVATCTGTDCGDVSYTWSGNGLNYNGQTVYFDAPSSNGTFTYTVTASRMGCTNKTATGTINVSGCGTTLSSTNCTINDYSAEIDITYKP
ncbi:MAG: hypothetical protein JWP57_816 [Spirosoma sp.]|nr:hypothetical protein [Spirosoma sp.]